MLLHPPFKFCPFSLVKSFLVEKVSIGEPKLCVTSINYVHTYFIFSPFWRPQVGIESVSEMANIFPVFYTKIFPVSGTLLSPFPIPFLSPFPIPFLSPFPIPFYPRFCFPPFPEPFQPPVPDAAMHSYLVPCPQSQNRTQQRTIRKYSSPLVSLVSGHKSSCR